MNLTVLENLEVDFPFADKDWFGKTLGLFHQELSRSRKALVEYAEFLSRDLLWTLSKEAHAVVAVEASGLGSASVLKINGNLVAATLAQEILGEVFAVDAENPNLTHLDPRIAHLDVLTTLSLGMEAYKKMHAVFAKAGLTDEAFQCAFTTSKRGPDIHLA